MNTEFFNALDALEAERGISKAHMMEKIEAALTRAYQREKGGLENVKVVMDEVKKDIKVYQVKRIVEVVESFETEISLEDAKKIGAHGVFDSKYGEKVKVYFIGDIDKQICGGPHAKNTGDLHHFKIQKEESSSSGIRRIKAILD